MLQCIQSKIDALNREGVTAIQHSLHEALPFGDNSFDVILNNQVMHYLFYPEWLTPCPDSRGIWQSFTVF